MTAHKNILVVGELNLDLILNQIQGFPVIGQEILANDMNLVLGSSSAIFASNIAQLGNPVSFCGMVGKDSFGRMVVDELTRRNIDTSFIAVSGQSKTGITVVMNYAEDRANVTYGGAMERFSETDIPFDQLSRFRHLHFSSYFLQKGLKEKVTDLFRSAKENGLTTSLDIQWDPENQWDFPYQSCLPYVDVFLPNESEILLLSKTYELKDAILKIGEYANTIVVKQGTKGASAYHKGAITSFAPFLHQSFVDAIGAGDSFNAGFISKYLAGASLDDSLQFANICGALSTTAAGGTAAFEDITSFKNKAKTLFNIHLAI